MQNATEDTSSSCPRTKAMTEYKKEKVLCVEDNKDECELIKEILSGYEVICVSTVSAACRHMDDAQYALIILDEHLPDGSGMQFCKKISRNNSETPVVMVSGDTYITTAEAQAVVDKLKKKGFEAFIVPPRGASDSYYRIQMGDFSERAAAQETILKLQEAGEKPVLKRQ